LRRYFAGTVEYREFRRQFKEWRAIAAGFVGQGRCR
jgi:hypothetical protein